MKYNKGQQVSFLENVPQVLIDNGMYKSEDLRRFGTIVSFVKRPVQYGPKVYPTWFAVVRVEEWPGNFYKYQVRIKDLRAE